MYHYKLLMSCHWFIPHFLLRHFWKKNEALLNSYRNHQEVLIPDSYLTTALCLSFPVFQME